jgi:hypothetical protein
MYVFTLTVEVQGQIYSVAKIFLLMFCIYHTV